MFDFFKKILESPAAAVTVMGFLIAAMIFLVRLDSDVRHLQRDVTELQTTVAELQMTVAEMQVSIAQIQANQLRILDALENIEYALANHTHDDQGRAVMPLPRSR